MRIVMSFLYLVCFGLSLEHQAAAAETPPKVIFILADDLGYGDLGCFGQKHIQTPHIDRLAAESSQLTDYHVAPTCSPTRAAPTATRSAPIMRS